APRAGRDAARLRCSGAQTLRLAARNHELQLEKPISKSISGRLLGNLLLENCGQGRKRVRDAHGGACSSSSFLFSRPRVSFAPPLRSAQGAALIQLLQEEQRKLSVQRGGQQPPVPVRHASFLEHDSEAPDHQHVPNGVWVIVGLLNFIAYTLDGVDGKQARRTNSSTPLGELFDHGLDSWACVYFVVTVYSTFGRGSTGVSVFVLYLLLWVVLFSFILSHWEKYNTGILFLPWGYDISQVTISIVYIVTAIVGVEAWYAPFLFNFLYRDLFTTMIIACALTVTLPMSLYNFYKAYKNNTLKHHSVYEIMLPLVSPVLLFVLCTTWIFVSPMDILEVHPRLFYFMVGTAFANISCQLIVCQMSSTRCQPLNWMLLPIALVLSVVVSGFAPNSETLLLYLLTAFLTLAHIHYGVVVVSQLSRHFNIRPFSLKKPTPD
uniref:Selenoprotein I n=1 Tax=Anas platyrhynchos platyrhynchos TaxID=8840 RepID=A0A493TE91_ANAPP